MYVPHDSINFRGAMNCRSWMLLSPTPYCWARGWAVVVIIILIIIVNLALAGARLFLCTCLWVDFGGNPLVDMITEQLLLEIKCTCGLGGSVECPRYMTVLRNKRSYPRWRCSIWTLVAGSSIPHVEHLHWEYGVIRVLLSGRTCTTLVVSVVAVAATTIAFTH